MYRLDFFIGLLGTLLYFYHLCCLNLDFLDGMDGVRYYLANVTISTMDSSIVVDGPCVLTAIGWNTNWDGISVYLAILHRCYYYYYYYYYMRILISVPGHISVWASVCSRHSAGNIGRLRARWWRHLHGDSDKARMEQRVQPRVFSSTNCCDACQGKGSHPVWSIQGLSIVIMSIGVASYGALGHPSTSHC